MKRNDSYLYLNNGNISKEIYNPLKEIFIDDNMKVLNINDNSNSPELYMYYCGTAVCIPGHFWGPAIRRHYLMHYILDGAGVLKLGGKEYKLIKNQGFLISPNDVSYYEASTTNPWKYLWVAFHGLNVKTYLQLTDLSQENPIFTFNRGDQLKNCMLAMVNVYEEYKYGASLRLQSLLYMLFSELIENSQLKNINNTNTSIKNLYIKTSVEYIEMNYMKDISISQLANHIGLDRSYLSSLFKRYLNTSPQMYLSHYRINKACEFLKNTHFSIAEVANMSGYNDPVVFQKFFKNIMGVSPNKYRKTHNSDCKDILL